MTLMTSRPPRFLSPDDQLDAKLIENDSLATPRTLSFRQLSNSIQGSKSRGASAWTWALVFVPVVGELLLSVGTAAVMFLYVDKQMFNIHDRRPTFAEADGSQITIPSFALLQTDVTTILSIALAVIRLLAGAWLTGVCWRCAIILLEKDGMRLRDFNRLVSHSVQSMFTFCFPRKNGHIHLSSMFLSLVILLLALPAQYAAPLLTGSITWVPSFHMAAGNVSVSRITSTHLGPGQNAWDWYNDYSENRGSTRLKAAALASIAWSISDARFNTTGLMKRIVPAAKNLAVNSTLADLTLPFFVVHSIHWFSNDDMAANTVADLLNAIDRDKGSNNISDPVNPLTTIAPTLGFLPSTPYKPPYNDTTHAYEFPPPTKVVAQTGLIALYWDRVLNPPGDRTSCPQLSTAYGPCRRMWIFGQTRRHMPRGKRMPRLAATTATSSPM